MRRRAAVKPVIGHLKDDHRMRRNHLKGRQGDRINAVRVAAGYNFSLLLRWFRRLLCALLLILACALLAPPFAYSALGRHSSPPTIPLQQCGGWFDARDLAWVEDRAARSRTRRKIGFTRSWTSRLRLDLGV
jgi:hypothetical protein